MSIITDLPTFESDGLAAKQILLPVVSRGFKSARWSISTLNPAGHTSGLSRNRLKRELSQIHKISREAYEKSSIICNKVPLRLFSTMILSIALTSLFLCIVALVICSLLNVLKMDNIHSESDIISSYIVDFVTIRNTIIFCSVGGVLFSSALSIGLIIECKAQRNLENQYIASILAVHQHINGRLFSKYQRRGISWGIAVHCKDSKRLCCIKRKITFYSIIIRVNGQSVESPFTATSRTSSHGGHRERAHSEEDIHIEYRTKGEEEESPMPTTDAPKEPLHIQYKPSLNLHDDSVRGQVSNVFRQPTGTRTILTSYDRILTPSEGLYGSSLSMTADAYLPEPHDDDSIVLQLHRDSHTNDT